MRFALAATALLTLTSLACSSGESDPSSPAATASPPPVVSAAQAIRASAEKFQTDVETFEGTFSMEMGSGESGFEASGDIRFRAPGDMYMTMDFAGILDMTILALGNDMYFKMGDDWVTLDYSELGIDLEGYAQYVEDKGPISYADMVEQMEGAERLDDEEIDGRTYLHFRSSIDVEEFADIELPEGLIDPELIEQTRMAFSGMTTDVLIDAETLLPRRTTMDMEMDVEGESFNTTMRMDYDEYNVEVDIPDAPDDAKPFELPGF